MVVEFYYLCIYPKIQEEFEFGLPALKIRFFFYFWMGSERLVKCEWIF